MKFDASKIHTYDKRDYDPKRGHRKVCPVCCEEFWGRKNKKYHPECKVYHNNHRMMEKRQMMKPVVDPLTKNETILRENYQKSRREGGLTLKLLEIAGFNPSVFSKLLIKTDQRFHVCVNHMWSVVNNKIIIEFIQL